MYLFCNFLVAYCRYMKGDVLTFKRLWDNSIKDSLRQKCRDTKREALKEGHADWFEVETEVVSEDDTEVEHVAETEALSVTEKVANNEA